MPDLTRAPAGGGATAALKWLALLLVPFCALVIVHWHWAPDASASDYAQYLLHARALVEGRPYAETGYLYQPAAGLIGPSVLPPGLPLTLAPLVALGGVHTPLVRLLMVLSVLLFAALATWRLARDVEPWQAALGGAFAAYAIETSRGTVAAMADPGFAALMWATIIVVDRDGRWTWRRVAAVTALGFAALSYRTAGIALIPGLLLHALISRDRLGARAVVPAVLWIGAGAIGLALGLRIPFADRIVRSMNDLSQHLSTFLQQYRGGLFDAELYPFASNALNDVYHIVASLLVLLGLVSILWRARRTFMVTLTVAYGLLLFVAPVAEPRYAWLLFPLFATSLAHGASLVLRRLGRTWQPRTQAWVAGAALAALLLLAVAKDARRSAPPSLVRHADAQSLFAWLTQRKRSAGAAESLRVAFYNPRVVAMETRIPAMGFVPRTAPGMIAALTRMHATHIIWQGTGLGDASNPGLPPCVQRAANRLPEEYPAYFTIEFRNPTFRVYRFTPDSTVVADSEERIRWTGC